MVLFLVLMYSFSRVSFPCFWFGEKGHEKASCNREWGWFCVENSN